MGKLPSPRSLSVMRKERWQDVLSSHTLTTHADHPANFLAKSQRIHKILRSLMSSTLPQPQTKTLATGSVSPSKPPILVLAFGMALSPESIRSFERCRWVCHDIVAFLSQANIPSPRTSSRRLIQHCDPC